MNYTVKMTDTAVQDLQEIATYIAVELQNRPVAKRKIRQMQELIFALSTMPERYPLVKDEYLAQKGYRCIPVDHYLIFYTVNQPMETVYVVRILYGKRDWRHFL